MQCCSVCRTPWSRLGNQTWQTLELSRYGRILLVALAFFSTHHRVIWSRVASDTLTEERGILARAVGFLVKRTPPPLGARSSSRRRRRGNVVRASSPLESAPSRLLFLASPRPFSAWALSDAEVTEKVPRLVHSASKGTYRAPRTHAQNWPPRASTWAASEWPGSWLAGRGRRRIRRATFADPEARPLNTARRGRSNPPLRHRPNQAIQKSGAIPRPSGVQGPAREH